MKLKYYLRGLGIGIILTTLIITISGSRKKLSDSEIITRAMELGMVMKEDPKGNLDEVMEAPEDTAEDTAEDISENNPENTQGNDNTGDTGNETAAEGEKPAASEEENSPSADQDAGQKETEDTEQNPAAEPTNAPAAPTASPVSEENSEGPESPVPSDDGTAQTGDKITFTVEKGMSSGKVAAMLESIGLIESAEEFNSFIIQKGKAGEIMIGKYTVSGNATFEEILNTITK